MVDGFEHLQRLGAQKIHETTHISKKNLERMLEKSFSELNKIQFMGFISILEREYSIDLTGLKEEFLAYYEAHLPEEGQEEAPLVLNEPKKRKSWLVGAAVALIAIILFFAFNTPDEPKTVTQQDINTGVVAEAAAVVKERAVEPSPAEEPEVVEEPVAVPLTLRIIPKTNLWIGMIDLNSGKRTQKLTDQPFELDPDTVWLMILGHGNVKVETTQKVLDLSDRKRTRFFYKEGSIRQITQEEFIVMNQGRDW